MKRLIITVTAILLLSLMLSACSEESNSAEDMYQHLEKSVELEQSFESAQQELVEIENQENQLYSELMDINLNELEEVHSKAEEALSLVEERRELIDQEMESIDAAKEEFDKAEQYTEELDEEASENADQMISKMNERYDAFVQLHEAYQKSLDEDAELYEMLQDEELEKEELDQQVEDINESYSNVTSAQESFNQLTQEFNEAKREFYESSGLDVEFSE